MRKCTVLLLWLTLALTLLSSCRQAEDTAPKEPNAVLLSPGDGTTAASDALEVRIYLQNFNMTGNSSQANKANEGHAIYYLDVTAPINSGEPAMTAPGTYTISSETKYVWTNLQPGQHVFSVQLVNNDNTPLLPPVVVRANVTTK